MEELPQNKSLVGLNRAELSELLHSWDQPEYRAKQIYKWIHHQNVDGFDEMTNLSKSLRNRLSENFRLKTLSLHQREIAADGTEKYLWKLYDDRFIESVLIPETRRNTICISSQVGCSLGCKFCATGTMGLIRNLTTGEIVEQVLQIKKLSKHRITNVVFMGMGEPFMNYHRSVQAAQILGDPEGLAIAGKRITISTSGVAPKIIQYADEKLPFGLAISLHAPTQELRESIMPIAKKFPLDELLESAKYYTSAKKRNRITFEYVLLHGINDSVQQAKELIKLLSPLRCKLNLIPCNQNDLGYVPPSDEEVNRFAQNLMQAPFAITVRKNRGEDITAACGQLAVKTVEKVIYMK
jgi:23S rRNA (adenine2503-C2)-methyltransferase